MHLDQGMTHRQKKRKNLSKGDSNGKRSTWIEFSKTIGLTKDIGRRGIINNQGSVGKVNSAVARERGTY